MQEKTKKFEKEKKDKMGYIYIVPIFGLFTLPYAFISSRFSLMDFFMLVLIHFTYFAVSFGIAMLFLIFKSCNAG